MLMRATVNLTELVYGRLVGMVAAALFADAVMLTAGNCAGFICC